MAIPLKSHVSRANSNATPCSAYTVASGLHNPVRHRTMCSRTRVLINNTRVQRHRDGTSQLMRNAIKATM